MKKKLFVLATAVLFGLTTLSFASCSKNDAESGSTPSSTESKNSGHYITLDSDTIYGEKITNEYFKDNELTLVNIMATWCGPCVNEMPELQVIDSENNGFGVVGVVVDTFDEMKRTSVESAVEEAKEIAKATGVTYPLAIPTADFLSNTLNKTAALLPMSFIVDTEGKIVKGPIAGARDKAKWLDILESTKEALNK